MDKLYERPKEKAQEMLWVLLAAGADVNITDADGETIRDHAPEGANDSLGVMFRVDECLKLGVDLNSKDASGKTSLFYITENDIYSAVQARMVETLLKAGADPNIQNNNGRTPIFAAGSNEHGREVWQALEMGGVDTKIRDTDGRKPCLSYCSTINYSSHSTFWEL